MTKRPQTFVTELPVDTEVTLCVEAVFKKDEHDNCFRLECRIVDGEHIGEMINLYFYRMKKDGSAPRKDTTALLEILTGARDSKDVRSFDLQSKIFKTTPWKPANSKYQMFGKFKLVGTNDAF
ncbi:MAG TPA: hypothetical protein VE954_43185 [Oligoflexus sp.]|uniref:hypothetical protein n=1 Tax=Oligoflexus sp. TaxID=1971216 RepID=UPI002D7388C0|nr:hypothetical protein [Oligoflexus sp.]HYX39949.1 hypothetical protein [Oligoflexus sp.]